MALNFGLYQGMNVKVDYDARMQRNLQERAYERQTRVDAENKAKLLGEDFKLASVSSPYNRQRLNDFYKKKIIEIGDFVLKNNDLELNPAKMLQFKMMKQELLDNDIVSEDMNFKTEYDATVKWLHENPEAASEQDVQGMLTQMENYKNYGTTDLMAKERQKYLFVNPDSKVDLTKVISDVYGKTKPQARGYTPDGRTYTFQKEEDLVLAAETILADPKNRRVAQKQFNALPEEARKKLYSNDLATYVKKMGSPFAPAGEAPSDVKIFAPGKGGKKSGSGDSSEGIKIDPFKAMLERARADKRTDVPPTILENRYVSEGIVNLSDGIVISSKGADVMNPSKDFSDIPTAKQAQILSTAKATPGDVIYDPNRGYFSEWTVEMPGLVFKEFMEDHSGIDNDVFGDGFNFHGEGDNDVYPSWGEKDVTDKYRSEKDKDGNTIVKFTMRKPLPVDDQAFAMEMGKHWNSINGDFAYTQDKPEAGPIRPYIETMEYPQGSSVTVNGVPGKVYTDQNNEHIFIAD